MIQENNSISSSGPIVVPERAWKVNFLFGFLTVAFAVALVRGWGDIDGSVIVGVMLVATIGVWLLLRFRPARLEISPEVITYSHRGQSNPTRLPRTSGDLYVHTSHVTWRRTRLDFLMVTGCEEAVPLQFLDRREVEQACLAKGWRFADGRG